MTFYFKWRSNLIDNLIYWHSSLRYIQFWVMWYLDSLWGHPQELLSAWPADIYRGDLRSPRDWILHCSPFNSDLTPTPFNSEPCLPNFVSSTWGLRASGTWVLARGPRQCPSEVLRPCQHTLRFMFIVPPQTLRFLKCAPIDTQVRAPFGKFRIKDRKE